MKSSLKNTVAALVLAGLALSTARAGSEILLYPLARAFGSPPESELVKCRQAFRELQSGLGGSRVVVEPVLFVDGHRRQWRADLAGSLCREAAARTTAKLVVAPSNPSVPQARFRHNQLRYTWERAAQYAGWVREAHPAGDFVWCAEIWGHDGKLGAVQVYLLDPSGRIAYCQLFNSHHFGENLPLEGDRAVRLIVEAVFEHLRWDADRVFPPHGVG